MDHTESEKNFKESLNLNFLSLCKILESKEIQQNLKSIIYISTLQVYGDQKFIYSEQTKTDPKNIYGLTHVLCETYLKYYSLKNAKNCIIYRVSNSYGVPEFERKSSWNNVINDFVRNAFNKSNIIIKSHGLFKRDFIYIDDLSNNILRTFRGIKGYKIINVGSFKVTSVLKIAQKVKEVGEKYLNRKINIQILGKKDNNKHYLKFNSNLKFTFKSRKYESGILKIFKYLESK